MPPLFRRVLALLLPARLAVPAWCADLSLMPVVLHLDRQNDRGTVQVQNNGSEAVVLQADAIAWTREGGVDRDGHTDGLIVNPPLFTVQPGQTQIVRVGLRRNSTTDQEQAYRMVLREVPVARASDSGQVNGSLRVLVQLRVPVYVAPARVQRDVRWQAQRDFRGDVLTQVSNHGNVHLKVGALRLREDGAAAVAEHQAGDVLFPGETRSFRLRPRTPLAGRALTLEVVTDRGTQDVALVLAPR